MSAAAGPRSGSGAERGVVMQQLRVPCVFMRGGTSRGAYLWIDDLPADPVARDQLILGIYGSPDVRQIDGLGGADSLTSKVAILSPPSRPDADIDYTFGQVGITTASIDYKPNCGNISSGVGPYAIARGLVPAVEPVTRVRIWNTNTRKFIVAEVPVRDGEEVVDGDCAIDGVPGTGARILLDFLDVGGGATGKLLPTGRPCDTLQVDGKEFVVSLVDAGNPYVFLRAEDLGLDGTESVARVNGDRELLDYLERIRGHAAVLYGFVQDPARSLADSPNWPKIAYVAAPRTYTTASGRTIGSDEIDLCGRGLSAQILHKAYAVTGALATAAAARVPGSIVHTVCATSPGRQTVRIGHPAGILTLEAGVAERGGEVVITRAALERTARRIMDGYVYVSRARVPALAREPVSAGA
jgi:hypothetical protein